MTFKILIAATTLAIGGLLMTLQPRPERHDTTTPRFDDPDAAARSDLARRQPTDRPARHAAAL